MDRLEAMSILLSVVETGSLSAAGRKLNVPLATVSRKVSELEAHLGARLLHRRLVSLRRPDCLALRWLERCDIPVRFAGLFAIERAHRDHGGSYQP